MRIKITNKKTGETKMSNVSGAVGLGGSFLGLLIGLVAIWGWIHNIIMLTSANFHPLGAEVILRVVGIFVGPLGVILGLFVGHF